MATPLTVTCQNVGSKRGVNVVIRRRVDWYSAVVETVTRDQGNHVDREVR